jgi:hypothetical protein
LVSNKLQLLLGQLLALQDSLKIQQSLEPLLNRKIQRIVGEIGPSIHNQSFNIPVQCAQVYLL